MGLVSKLKNILFEEEEVEIPVIEKKEKKPEVVREYKELPKKEEVKVTNYQNYDHLEPVIREEKKMEDKVRFNADNDHVVSERELFKSEKTFNFPAFDEEEFDSFVPKKRTTNVLGHERRKTEKKNEYKPEYRKDYKKPEETKEVKKFKPSPIISPVYGILDKNYTPDEITTRTEVPSRTLDVDTVRKKAFGSSEEKTVEKIDIKDEELVMDQVLEEKIEKARTIDELLKDSSDEVININDAIDDEIDKSFSEIEPLENEEELNPVKEEKHESNLENDTLENDLFDLIDSMYENREEEK